MANKQLIIIPGSCSSESNWFDQIDHFQKLGYEVNFLDLEAHKYKTLAESTINLFRRLKTILVKSESDSIESLFETLDDQIIIMAHSMGAMLLLKILSEPNFYRNEDRQTYDTISKSKIVFIQVPLKVNRKILGLLNILKYLFYPFLFIYRFTIHKTAERILVLLKKLFKQSPEPISKVSALTLNLALMHNSLWGSKIDEFGNLINYYKHWDEFSLERFFVETNDSDFERAIMRNSASAIRDFDLQATLNYYFTVGNPDLFCDNKLIKEFAARIGAQVLELDPGFHSPQHMPWCQDKLHKTII